MSAIHQLIAILVALIWGTNFVFIRYGLDELPAFTFAALRFALVAFPLIFIFPKPQVQWRMIIAYGLAIGFGQFGLMFWAMQSNISPGLASLIVQMQVFFTIFISALLFKEMVSFYQWLSLSICFLGLVTIVVFTDGQTTGLGILLVLLAALSWAIGNVIVKQVGKVNLLAFIVWSSLFSVPPLVAMAVIFEGPTIALSAIQSASWQAWLVVAWQTIGNTLIGYALWNMLLRNYPAAMVTPWALLVPVFGIVSSWLLLDESLPWWKLLACCLIFIGLIGNIFGNKLWQKS